MKIIKYLSVSFITAMLAVFCYSEAAFAGACMERRVMRAFLSEQYQEHPVALGLIGADSMMELFVSETGTWSVVLTNSNRLSCIHMAGTNWGQSGVAKSPEL